MATIIGGEISAEDLAEIIQGIGGVSISLNGDFLELDGSGISGGGATGAVLFDKVFEITLTGNVNYLNVPNIENYNKIEVNSTKKVDIKGLLSDNVPDGFTIGVHNVSTHEHKYKKNQNASPATYRFDSADIKVKKKTFIWWTWNSNDNRWNAQNNH